VNEGIGGDFKHIRPPDSNRILESLVLLIDCLKASLFMNQTLVESNVCE